MAVLAERVEAVRSDMLSHERLDQERLTNIHGRLNLLFTAFAAGLTILVGVAGWSLNRVYDNQQDQLALLRSVRAEVTSPSTPPR